MKVLQELQTQGLTGPLKSQLLLNETYKPMISCPKVFMKTGRAGFDLNEDGAVEPQKQTISDHEKTSK